MCIRDRCLEAFDVETYSGTARRSSQMLLASTAACRKQWITASLDINMVRLLVKMNVWCVLPCRLDRSLRSVLFQDSRTTTSHSTAYSA
eukprot:4869640-Pyramimonas_sp.AAC.2